MSLHTGGKEKKYFPVHRMDTGKISGSRIFQTASAVAEQLQHHGHQCCIVGGAVRDLISGMIPSDVDMVTTATPEEMQKIFPDIKFAGASFGVMLLRKDGFEFEIATAREERSYMDGRHPENIRYTRDLDTDAMRRDFTVNAMRLDPVTGELSDPAGGLDDLAAGVIRTVGVPEQRFREDHLRMLRAVRFAARFNFTVEPETFQAMCRLSGLAAELSGERIRDELTRILTGKNPAYAVKMLHETGLLKAVLPEVDAMSGVTQPEEFHPEGDVFEHTMLMLEHMAMPDELLAWSVLLHDVGKPLTRSLDGTGRIRFFGHEERGAETAENILKRLHFSTASVQSVVQAVRNHMRMASVPEMRKAKIKKMLADKNFPLELELHRLDCIACHGFMESFLFLCDQLCLEPENVLPEPWVKGRDLIACGFAPSPMFKKVLEKTFDRQLADDFRTPAEALAYAAGQLKTKR